MAGIIDFFDIGHCRGPGDHKHISYIDVSSYRRWLESILNNISPNFEANYPTSTDDASLEVIALISLIINIFITIVLI